MRTILLSLVLVAAVAACRIDDRTYTGDDAPGTDARIDGSPDAQAVLVDGESTAPVTVEEGDTITVAVTLRHPPVGSLAVTVAADDDTKATVSPAALTFDSGNYDMPQLITISGAQDDDDQAEATSISLTAPDADGATVEVTVNDDESQAILVSMGDVTIAEGGSAQVGTRLRFQPAADVTVTVSSSDDGLVTASPATLTFTTSNWDQEQDVTIVAAQDDDVETDVATVSLAMTGATTGVVDVTVTDDDTLGLVVSTTSLTVGENTTGSFTVRLSHQPSATVTATVAPAMAGVYTVTPSTLTFNANTWSTPQTVTVSPVFDSDNVDESATATVSATGLATVNVNVSIDDTTQILSVGWPTWFGQSNQYTGGATGHLHAYKVEVTGTGPVTLDRWGVLSSGAGSTMIRYALYTDGVGGPGNLVAWAGPFSAATGQYDVPDTMSITPGTYWLAFQVNGPVNLGQSTEATAADAYCNKSNTVFADPPPATWVPGICIPNYYLNFYFVGFRQ